MDSALRFFYLGCLVVCLACAVTLIAAPTVHRARAADHAAGGHASAPVSAQADAAPALRPLASTASFFLTEEQGDNGLGYSMEYHDNDGGMLAVSESRSVPDSGRVLVLRLETGTGTPQLVLSGSAQVQVEGNLFGRALAWAPVGRRLAVSASGDLNGAGSVYVYTVDDKGRVLQDTQQELEQVKGRHGRTGAAGVGWTRAGATLLTGEGEYTDQWYANPRSEHMQWRDEFERDADLLASAGNGGLVVLAKENLLHVYRETDASLVYADQVTAAGSVTGVRLFDDGSGGVVLSEISSEFVLQAMSVAGDGTATLTQLTGGSAQDVDSAFHNTITWDDGVPRFPSNEEMATRHVCCTRTGAYVFVGVPAHRAVSVFRRVADGQYAKTASLADPVTVGTTRFGSSVACSADEVGDLRLFVGDSKSNQVYLFQTS